MRYVILLFIISVALPSIAFSKTDCASCHGQRGMPGYIDPIVYGQSVHAAIECVNCHINIVSYPHGSVLKVNCGICHYLGRSGAPKERALKYKMSVHGTAIMKGKADAPSCQNCHGSHDIYPAGDERARTSRRRIPALCSVCHPQEFNDYKKSIHGIALLKENNVGAPNCFDCHLEHYTPETKDPAWKLSLIRECGNCHAKEINAYRKTYHGKVTRLGYATMAKCSDCHGSHMILPAKDDSSRISKNNILKTCRSCHQNATGGFVKFYAHAEETDRERYPILYYTYLFMTTLLIGVFTFFFIHTFLWAFRSLKERMRGKGGE